jgi:hypothetical protein
MGASMVVFILFPDGTDKEDRLSFGLYIALKNIIIHLLCRNHQRPATFVLTLKALLCLYTAFLLSKVSAIGALLVNVCRDGGGLETLVLLFISNYPLACDMTKNNGCNAPKGKYLLS